MLLHFSRTAPWVTRFSSRSAPGGRRMMGSVERGVSICFTTLPAFVRQVRDSQRDRLAHRPQGTIRASPFQAKVLFLLLAALGRLGLGRQRGRLLSKVERACVGPHAVQDDGQFAGHRHTGARHAAAPGDVRAPRPEARPRLRAHEQHMRGRRCGRSCWASSSSPHWPSAFRCRRPCSITSTRSHTISLRTPARSGRMAPHAQARYTAKPHPAALARALARAQSGREPPAVPPRKPAIQPDLRLE